MKASRWILLLALCVAVLALPACGDDSGGATDGGTDADTDADSGADAGDEECTFETPYCDGEVAVSCEGGEELHAPCGPGTFCNFGACETSNVVRARCPREPEAGFETQEETRCRSIP